MNIKAFQSVKKNFRGKVNNPIISEFPVLKSKRAKLGKTYLFQKLKLQYTTVATCHFHSLPTTHLGLIYNKNDFKNEPQISGKTRIEYFFNLSYSLYYTVI